MKDYSNMSDFEINKAVAMLLLKDFRYEYYQHGTCNGVEVYSECGFVDGYDYCNNPSDAWSIIMENKIDIQHRDGFGTPCARNCASMEADKNPLRAAMIVYLMMKDEER